MGALGRDVTNAWDRARLLASPFLGPLAPILRLLSAHRWPTLDEMNALASAIDVRSGGGMPLRFVDAADDSDATRVPYESRIFTRGEVATRLHQWHDLFNALAWLAFPLTKATLNMQHQRAIEQCADERRARARGTARDVLTLFDESGLIVACADRELAAMLASFRWKALFWERRDAVTARMRFLAFGHGLHEKGLAPFRGITAKAIVIDVADAFLSLSSAEAVGVLDERASMHFARDHSLLSTRALQPVPVLGIPGWTPDNERAAYYDDTDQFRPGRMRAKEGA